MSGLSTSDVSSDVQVNAHLKARIAELEAMRGNLLGTRHQPCRRDFPMTHHAVDHEFCIDGHSGRITVSLYADGSPCEVFLNMVKEGSTIDGLVGVIGTITGLALQYNVPIDVLAGKLVGSCFVPHGFTKNPDIRVAKSISDYVFRWLTSDAFKRVSQVAVGSK